jgi:uncharacterized membrane protein SirB2
MTIMFFTSSTEILEYNKEVYEVSTKTDLFVSWTYIVFVIVVVITLGLVVFKFVLNAINDPKSAIKPVSILVGAAALFLIAYGLGDNTPLKLIGYEGNENTAPWLKLTDMFLYVIYILGIVASALIVYSGVSKYFK